MAFRTYNQDRVYTTMIVIAQPYIRYSTNLDEPGLESGGEALLHYAENVVQRHYRRKYEQYPFYVEVRVERGSTRSWVTVSSLIGILVLYGNIRQSAEFLVKDAHYLGSELIPGVARRLHLGNEEPDYVQVRKGVPGKICRLFTKVESGELSDQGALHEAKRLLGENQPSEAESIIRQLSMEFRQAKQGPIITSERLGLSSKHIAIDRKMRPLDLPPLRLPVRRRTGVVLSRDEKGKVRSRRYWQST